MVILWAGGVFSLPRSLQNLIFRDLSFFSKMAMMIQVQDLHGSNLKQCHFSCQKHILRRLFCHYGQMSHSVHNPVVCDLLAFFSWLNIINALRSCCSFHGWPSSLSTWCNLRDLYRFIVGTTGMCVCVCQGQRRIEDRREMEKEPRKCQNIGWHFNCYRQNLMKNGKKILFVASRCGGVNTFQTSVATRARARVSKEVAVVAMAINMPVTQQAFWHHTHEMGSYLRCFMAWLAFFLSFFLLILRSYR